MRTLLAAVALPAVLATSGIDVSAPISVDAAKCMRGSKSFAIVRGWQSFGAADPNAPGSIAAFWDGGFAHVDTYLFPCRGKDAASQVDGLVSYLASHGTKYGQIWLDIETNPSGGCGWGIEDVANNTELLGRVQADNCDYIGQLLTAISGHGIAPGVYASEYMWSSIAGSGCTVGSAHALWYAHYDGNPSFSDYTPFGGWAHPAMKQYSGTGSLCGVGIDSNWYP